MRTSFPPIVAAVAVALLGSFPLYAQPVITNWIAYGADPDLQVVETRLTDNEYGQFDAAISGIYTVWTDARNGTADTWRVVLHGIPGPLVEGAGN